MRDKIKKENARQEAIRNVKEREKPAASIPERIVGLLVPEMGVGEIMILIRKMKSAGRSEMDEFSSHDAEHKTGKLDKR